MDCERVREWSGAALLSEASWEPSSEVREHLATCAACREELVAVREAWSDLKALSSSAEQAAAGPAVPEAVSRAFVARSDGKVRWAPPALARAAVVLLALGAGAIGGWVAARSGMERPSVAGAAAPPVTATDDQYLLLIRETTATLDVEQRVGSAALVEEYAAWATSLAEAGRLIAAEKLAEAGAAVSEAGSETVAGSVADAVSGFFLVRATDEAAAFAIARESPHVRHGGVIEVRRIEPTREGT